MSHIDRDLQREAFQLMSEYLDRSGANREALLAELQVRDTSLYERVRALLLADAESVSRSFLSGGVGAQLAAQAPPGAPASDLTGQRFGPWRTLRLLGAGGMGQVWLAERSDQLYRGQAAIKLLGRVAYSLGAKARFVREGEILGRLSHPNIARLLDAGITEQNDRYLVIEYVDGQRLDRYCDAKRLTIEERIALFCKVCAAITHAHQNLIVHRDIKPSNVLVTEAGEVKLLDFGVAKLLETERTGEDSAGGDAPTQAQTELTQMAGAALTPDYAAPEQILGAPVTTRTDVYSLGVMLYVLLTGEHPYATANTSAARRLQAALDDDPRPASATVTRAATDTDVVAVNRRVSAKRLREALAGELDNVLARAMRKAPTERYASAEELALELQRYLRHEPVSARPDDALYRVRKFLRRNRLSVSLVTATALAIVAGLVIAIWQAGVARQEAGRATLEANKATAVKEFLLDLFKAGDVNAPGGSASRSTTVAELIDIGAARMQNGLDSQPEVRAEILDQLGNLYLQTQSPDKSERLYRDLHAVRVQQFGARDERTIDAWISVGTALRNQGKYVNAQKVYDEALTMLDANNLAAPAVRGRALLETAYAMFRSDGDDTTAIRLAREAIALLEPLSSDERLYEAYYSLGRAQENAGALRDAVTSYERGIALAGETLGARSTAVAGGQQMRARALMRAGDFSAAEQGFETAAELFRATAGEQHRYYIDAMFEYNDLLARLGRWQEALPHLQRGFDSELARRGPQHQLTARARTALARSLYRSGQEKEALAHYRAIAAQDPGDGARPDRYLNANIMAALIEWRRGNRSAARLAYAEAIPYLRRVQASLSVAGAKPSSFELSQLLLVAEYLLEAEQGEVEQHDSASALLAQVDAASVFLRSESADRAVEWQTDLLRARQEILQGEAARGMSRIQSLQASIAKARHRDAYGHLEADVLLALASTQESLRRQTEACRSWRAAKAVLERVHRPESRLRVQVSRNLARCVSGSAEQGAAIAALVKSRII